MAIYLHPIDEQPDRIIEEDWVEIDLVSWDDRKSEFPIKLVLIRRLNDRHPTPYLQELMFEGLYRGRPIKELTLEIPQSTNQLDYAVYKLRDVQVESYVIFPEHSHSSKAHEKVIVYAKSKEQL